MCASRFPICSFIAVHSSRSTRFSLAVAVAVLLTVSQARAQGELQIAELGDCELESGAVIENCRVGYRTLGQLDADGSNAVLFPAWFSGTSEQIGSWWVGPDKLVDDSEWFVIAVDPIGNGVSSSPSNSPGQAAGDFPTYTMRDMVKIERRLVTEVLGLSSLHAVIGISMSGLDVFEWLVSYPDFVRKGVPIVGSPRTSGYDLLRWQTELEVLEASQSCRCFDAGRFVALPHLTITHSHTTTSPTTSTQSATHTSIPTIARARSEPCSRTMSRTVSMVLSRRPRPLCRPTCWWWWVTRTSASIRKLRSRSPSWRTDRS
jgi:homoserine O-acetyltransferase